MVSGDDGPFHSVLVDHGRADDTSTGSVAVHGQGERFSTQKKGAIRHQDGSMTKSGTIKQRESVLTHLS